MTTASKQHHEVRAAPRFYLGSSWSATLSASLNRASATLDENASPRSLPRHGPNNTRSAAESGVRYHRERQCKRMCVDLLQLASKCKTRFGNWPLRPMDDSLNNSDRFHPLLWKCSALLPSRAAQAIAINVASSKSSPADKSLHRISRGSNGKAPGSVPTIGRGSGHSQ